MAVHADEQLIAHVHAAQDHVLTAVEGLTPAQLEQVVVPSGWSIARLLSHLTFDDEIFWIHAILTGLPEGIDQVQDGWRAQAAPGEAVVRYREAVLASRELIAAADLDAPPRWWPSEDVFPFPAFGTGRDCVWRLLTETLTHAGHLDIVRELLDGRQHLVVG